MKKSFLTSVPGPKGADREHLWTHTPISHVDHFSFTKIHRNNSAKYIMIDHKKREKSCY